MTRFHRLATTFALILLAAALIGGCGKPTPEGEFTIGSRAPGFHLRNVDNRQVSLADYRGRPAVLVVFTCNHCPYSVAYEDRLIRYQKGYSERGVQFLLINSNDPKKKPEDSFEKMQIRAREKNFPFPYLLDETQQIAKAYGASRTPEVYLLDSNLTLVYHGRIDDNIKEDEVTQHDLRSAIEHLLVGHPEQIDPKVTKAFGCTIKWRDRNS